MQPNTNAPQPNVPQPPVIQVAPSPADLQAQANQPAPPAPQPPAAPQPAPQAQPPQQQPQAQPQAQPQGQPQPAPVQGQPQPNAQQPPAAPPAQSQSQTPDYDKMLDAYLGKPNTTQPAPLPKVPTSDDTAEITQFFEDFRKQTIQEAQQATLSSIRQLEGDKVAEQKAWDTVFEKYPQAKDPAQRNIIHNLRLGAMVSGGEADLTKVAEAYYEPQNTQYHQGYQAANQNTYVQRSQHLTGNNVSTPPQNVSEQTAYQQMAKGGSEGQNAAMLHVQALIDAGRIK